MVRFILTSLLLALAGLHAYWARGGCWPGRDSASLLEIVVGLRAGPGGHKRILSPWACWLVSLAFWVDAGVVLLHPCGLDPSISKAYWLSAGVFLLRGSLGFTSLFDYARGTAFYQLNRKFYSPLCLLMAGLHWWAR